MYRPVNPSPAEVRLHNSTLSVTRLSVASVVSCTSVESGGSCLRRCFHVFDRHVCRSACPDDSQVTLRCTQQIRLVHTYHNLLDVSFLFLFWLGFEIENRHIWVLPDGALLSRTCLQATHAAAVFEKVSGSNVEIEL
jgi:hypothetical protein